MAYIPKNKIQTGLYTTGGEYVLASTRQSYVGSYYKLSNGKIFSGENLNDPATKELLKEPTAADGSEHEGGTDDKFNIPTPPLLPTPQDYKNGEFIRYFICRRNQPLFIEIDKTTFNKYKQKDITVSWKIYKPFSLFWVLTGDINQVAQTNKNVTELTETKEKVLGLSLYLKENWTQYYKEKP